MDCLVERCDLKAIFKHGGFCAKHWSGLNPNRQRRILAAVNELREARLDAWRQLEPDRDEYQIIYKLMRGRNA
jgi:hypothetical protein